MGGLCSFMGARVMAHTSLECTCLENGRPTARRRKSSRCSGSSLLVPSSRLCGSFSADSPACSSAKPARHSSADTLARSLHQISASAA